MALHALPQTGKNIGATIISPPPVLRVVEEEVIAIGGPAALVLALR